MVACNSRLTINSLSVFASVRAFASLFSREIDSVKQNGVAEHYSRLLIRHETYNYSSRDKIPSVEQNRPIYHNSLEPKDTEEVSRHFRVRYLL